MKNIIFEIRPAEYGIDYLTNESWLFEGGILCVNIIWDSTQKGKGKKAIKSLLFFSGSRKEINPLLECSFLKNTENILEVGCPNIMDTYKKI